MDFLTLAKERCSVRQFKKTPIEQDKLDKILEAGRLAPTACNLQPQRILVLNSDEALNKLKECTSYHFDAPLALIIACDESDCWKRGTDGKKSGEVDASIVASHMMLEAAELGLGTTWVGSFNPNAVMTKFNFPKNFVPVAILPIGYPVDNYQPAPGHNQRKPVQQTVFYNKW